MARFKAELLTLDKVVKTAKDRSGWLGLMAVIWYFAIVWGLMYR